MHRSPEEPDRRPDLRPDLPHADGLGRLVDDDLTARLESWSAAARVDAAVGRRGRERWLRHQAEEEGTLTGVLADLAERGAPVALHGCAGRTHHGRVQTVGSDFVAVTRGHLPDVIVALAAVGAVVMRPGEPVAAGARRLRPELSLAQVVVGLGATRERVVLVAGEGEAALRGTLRAVGQDLATVRLDGDGHRGTAYVPLAAIREVMLGD